MGRQMPRGNCQLWQACWTGVGSDAMRCEAMQVEASGGLRHGFAEGRRAQSEQDWGELAVRLQGTEPRVTAKSADDNPKWPDKTAAAGPTTGQRWGLEVNRPADVHGLCDIMAFGGQKAANQGDSGSDRMWERWDIRQAGDPVECSHSMH